MKKRVLYLERKASESVSLEKVFKSIAANISTEHIEIAFEKLPYFYDTISTIKNLLLFRPSNADIYHITGHIHFMALVLPKNKTVLTVHDTRLLSIRKGLRRWVLKKLFFDLPIKKLRYITAISESTKQDVIKLTKCSPEKIRVIENPLTIEPLSEISEEFNQFKPQILHIGTTSNKNTTNTIRALRAIDCRLVIIGKLSESEFELLREHKIDFINKYELDDDAIRNEYQQADIVSFCSTFEGFGLPIIEAQAMRVAVITSDLSPMKEVAGGGALLIDPYSIESMHNGFNEIINNADLRRKLIERGSQNIKKYEPAAIAGKYEQLYLEIISINNKGAKK